MKSVEFLTEAEQNVAKKKVDQQLDQLSNQEIDALLSMIDKSLDEGRFDYNPLAGPAPGQSKPQTTKPQQPKPPPQQQKKQPEQQPPQKKSEVKTYIDDLDNKQKEEVKVILQKEKQEREESGEDKSENSDVVKYPDRYQQIIDFGKNLSHVLIKAEYKGNNIADLDISIDYEEDDPTSLSGFIEEVKLVQQVINQQKNNLMQDKKDQREAYSDKVASRSDMALWGAFGRGYKTPGGIIANLGRMIQRSARQSARQSHLSRIADIDNKIEELNNLNAFLKRNELLAKKKLGMIKLSKKKDNLVNKR